MSKGVRHTRGLIAVACFLASVAVFVPGALASPEPSAECTACAAANQQVEIPHYHRMDASTRDAIDLATSEALKLEDEIADLESELVSLDSRLQALTLTFIEQQQVVDVATDDLESAREQLSRRIIGIYKNGDAVALDILLEASSLPDLLTRLSIAARITELDNRAVTDAVVTRAEAAHQASVLEGLKLHELSLRQIRRIRLERLRRALAEQRLIIDTLTESSRRLITARRAEHARSRKAWMDSSIPLSEVVRQELAEVAQHDEPYRVAYYQPKRYRVIGGASRAVCSWYGNQFHGRRTASGQVFNQEDLTCASRSLPFGTYLALSRAGRRVVVQVTDRGPFINGRDLDLSRAAARALGFSGVEPVTMEIVEPEPEP